MSHPFLSNQLAAAHLADLHAEAERQRVIRSLRVGRDWRFWRRPRPGPDPGAVVAIPRRDRENVELADSTLRPVA